MNNESKNPLCLTVAELATRLECPFDGDGEVAISGVSSLESAGEGDLVFLAHPKHRPLLEQTGASAAIVPLEEKMEKIPLIRSKTPHLTFVKAIEIFFKPYLPEAGIHPTAVVSESASFGEGVSIGAYSVVGEDVRIGEGTVLFPHVTVYPGVELGKDCILHAQVVIREDCRIGNRVILQSGVKVGGDGYGFVQKGDGTHVKIPQMGKVVIEDDVEVGANTTIDRAAMDTTIIRKGTKIDNLVQIAHSVDIGENSIIISQAGIAGSSKIGKNVIIAGQAGIPDHIKIGDDSIVAAQCGVISDLPPGSKVVGSPHMNMKEFWRTWANIRKLPEIIKELESLKKNLRSDL